MSKKLNKIVDNILEQLPSQVGLKLPKLQKVGNKKSTESKAEIKLPKLKKVT